MIYLKKFEGFDYRFQEDFREFCQTHLAYLLDDYHMFIGANYFSLKMYSEDTEEGISQELEDNNPEIVDTILDPRLFKWDSIKDYFITFINHLSREYTIKNIEFFGFPKEATESYTVERYHYEVNEILEDDSDIITLIYSISIRVS
jgi:hypothetical protein